MTKLTKPARAGKHDPANYYCDCKRCRRAFERVHAIDRAFFNANPDRLLYCREFIEGEFPMEAVGGFPAGYRPIIVARLYGRSDTGQLRARGVYGWPVLMRCPNESDSAIIAALGRLGGVVAGFVRTGETLQ